MALLKLRHIEVFHAVYVAGTVSGAARALQVSQPSISKVLRHAESRIGFQLFRVVRGRLVPTDEAHVLFHQARDLHARAESLDETARNLRRGAEGHLRLAVLHSLGLDAVPAAIARFRADHPQVSFDIKTLHTEDIARALRERACDLAFLYDVRQREGLSVTKVGAGELVVLFHRDDLASPPERVSLEMFKGLSLIRLANAGAVGSSIYHAFNLDDADPLSVVVQTYFVAAALVRRRAGFAIVDEFTALASLTPELDYRPLADPMAFAVYGVHLEDHPMSRIEHQFVTTMQETLARLRA